MFSGIPKSERASLMCCLKAVVKHVVKGDVLFEQGEKVKVIGYVNSGSLIFDRSVLRGKHTVWERIGRGQTFCESFAYSDEPLPFSIIADEPCEVTLIDAHRLMKVCSEKCAAHTAIITNLARSLASENVRLTRKIKHVTEKSTREKLLSFLMDHAGKTGTMFTIPYDRQELADYLALDRSAMSAELSRMSRDGLIRYKCSRFELLTHSGSHSQSSQPMQQARLAK